MPVTQVDITTYPTRYEGFRARIFYTFNDGRVVTRKIRGLVNLAAAHAQADKMTQEVEDKEAERDASDVEAADGPITDTKQASREQIARQFLRVAMEEKDPFIALNKLQKAQEFFIARSWSPSVIRSRLNISPRVWTSITDRLLYLKANEQRILDYQEVLAGDS